MSRWRFPVPAASVALLAAGGVLLAATVGLAVAGRPDSPSPAPRAAAPAVPRAGGDVAGAVAAAQQRLRTQPKDDATWAALGSAYVQQARITADASWYPKAEQALRRSLDLRPAGNARALTGLGALANARHDFRAGLAWARRAEAVNPYAADVFGVQDDALTQLGDVAGAERAAQRMLDLEPGVPSFTRASYHFETSGRVDAARAALERALAEADGPADIAFCRLYLAELAFNDGDPRTAYAQAEKGLAAVPDDAPLLAGRAKAAAALGRTGRALTDYAAVTARVPLPQYLLEYGELLESLGRKAQAQQQFRLIAAEQRLLAANGVVDDLEAAVLAADHGSAADAVRHARAEWARRQNVLVADALAWALHRAGQDGEALTYARRAARYGWRNAGFAYHRGMIELALGRKDDARRSLRRALDINPWFSVRHAPEARRALAPLEDS